MDADFFEWLQSPTGADWFARAYHLPLLTLAEYFRSHERTVDAFFADIDAVERECSPHRGFEDLHREFLKGAQYLYEGRERAKRLTVKLDQARRRGEIFPKGFRDWWIAAWDADVAASEVRDE